jgi:hypothetical protein
VAIHTSAQMESLASTPSSSTTPSVPVISTKTVAPVNGSTTTTTSTEGPPSPVAAPKPRRLLFVSHYRSSLLLSTALAILAVDFHIFPRRFVKTEDYGTSLVRSCICSYH